MKITQKLFIVLLLFSLFFGNFTCSVSQSVDEEAFLQEEKAWRDSRDLEMRSPESWLTIAGLYWLEEGENSFGSHPENAIQFPANSAPPRAGKFNLSRDRITVVAEKGVTLKVNEIPISQGVLRSENSGQPDIVALNDLRMWIIKRGARFAVRLRDPHYQPFTQYRHLDYFPPSLKYKIQGEFFPHESPKTLNLETVAATETQMVSPGTVRFTIDRKSFSLTAFSAGQDKEALFFIFKDLTNGQETYEASRFLTAKFSEGGRVDLNFNRAHNPPCAYTLYATCPLPPPGNHLDVRIEAGEKKYPGAILFEGGNND